MLCISRKIGELIHVGDSVIEVLRLSRHRVVLGIRAPEHVEIRRDELTRRLAAGEQFADLEMELDAAENQRRHPCP